ncbi:uncharacterized protein Chro isoform X3 [Diabrotica undecimpunctata]|uniref:uncharacterized protein Chro isoform X3 n=1 Tax=Diabrotica undecimpunctata TaxID=50387 RepID=UPI003B64037F
MDEKSEHGDQTAETLEPVVGSLDEEGMDIPMDPVDTDRTDTDVSAVEPTENAGISEDIETPEVSEPNVESGDGNDDNNLISELNDVTLSAAATTSETDSFLDSFTTDNPTSETQTNDEQTSNAADSDLSMPSLVLPEEPNDISTEDINLDEKPEEKEEPVVEPPKKDIVAAPIEEMKEVQKEPVYSLEEELERMHEESVQPEPELDQNQPVSEKLEEVNVPESKVNTESKPTPIMKDSDLEEMLAADDVLQDPLMIKNAQQNLRQVDVLVCGNCHGVFHFVEEFKTHKSKTCSTKSNSTLTIDNNSEVWAFTLWKTKQMKQEFGRGQTQWELYKTWCALPESEKTSWISAGELLQYCHKLETAKVTEVKVHNKPVAKDDKDPLSLDGFGKTDSNKENSSVDNSKSPLLDVKRTVINKPKAVPTVPKVNNNSANTNKAMRSAPNLDKSEYAVEKIAAKRFNPKKKTWEYQIKWEHFTSEHNTWEPLSNLNHCRQMVDEFEEQLKKLKAEKAKQQQIAAAASKNTPKVKPSASSASSAAASSAATGPKNRPQRTSKQKALDQVKAWCGNISDEEGISLKRSRSPDSDESFEKRMKYEEMSEDSDGEVSKPKTPLRKIAPKPPASPLQVIKNGVGKNTPLPQNILIPDANGVVRINQKQLPSLSTGVYIMSKTAGIIKLDSSTSKVATSSGQMIVKVAPKIGQTHIKIMKKDGTSTQQVVQMSPKNVQQTPKALKSHLAKAKKGLSELKASPVTPKKTEVLKKQILSAKVDTDKKPMVVKKLPELAPKPSPKVFSKLREQPEIKEDESDDGLEELPFPEEIKLPEPEEEENKEFILDPTTGKIAGVEYPEPEPEPIEEAKSDSSLDNIVKLAAADITEEDLKNEPQEEPMDIEVHHLVQSAEPVKIIKTEPQIVPERRFSTASSTKQVVKMPVTSRKVIANPTSILNKALTGPQVIRRAVTGSAEKQQRVLNHSMARPIVNPVVRQTKTFVRTKPVAPKPRFNIASDISEKFIQPEHNSSPKNVYSFTRQVVSSPTMRKIGSTTIRSSPSGVPATNNQHKVQTKYVRTSSGLVQKVIQTQVRREPVQVRGQPERIERKIVQQKPKTVINMPSLISDDDLLLTTKPAQPKPKQAPVQPVQTIATLEAHEPEESHEAHKIAVVSEPSITQVPVAIQQEPEENVAGETSGINALAPDMSSFTLNDNDHPIFITGDDGTVYQVAGQNEQGQTILLTQGSDGQQQCLLVTNEIAETMETPAAEEAEPQQEIIPEISPAVTDPLSIKTDVTENSDQVVAQVVRAEPPSPGGTHKVVVMLPDGNLMITQVSPEEYASLELE